MSRRWLLSLLCLSLVLLCLVPLTRAGGEIRVNEANTRILLERGPAEVLLAVENSTGEQLNARVDVFLLDARSNNRAKTTQVHSIKSGSQTLRLWLPLSFSNLKEPERSEVLWYRLHYRLSKEDSSTGPLAEGIVSLSEITPDLFDIRVATSEVAREGSRYRARVQASHPITRRPAANVRVDGEITLEADNESERLHAAKTTDSKGYALLDFTIPQTLPEFPRGLRSASGEFHVTATRGSVVAKANGEILIDQNARILISTDKPLYQPGQVMHLRALVFSPSKHAVANQNILFRISDPEDLTIFRTVVKSSRFGVANAEWPIPENTRLGDYRVWVGVDGDEEDMQSVHGVRISRYDLPNFTVSVEPDRKFYLPGQSAEVKVRADYLFGQPLTRGHVRVVRETQREWNYREQKWDIEEGDKHEGEIDAKGFFTARIGLADAQQDIRDSEYLRFKDVTYAAYVTDRTTNRTEQRRFDLRVTKEPIHVYVLRDDYDWSFNRKVPTRFYVSTYYADGSPARCNVKVILNSINYSRKNTEKTISKSLAPGRTNRYGLVKFSAVRLPRDFEGESRVGFVVSAIDSSGAKGSRTEDVSLEDGPKVIVETDKALYRSGEPITALITSSVPDETLVVDVARNWNVIRSERLKLRGGRASITFPYRPEFRDQLTVSAYADFPVSSRGVGSRSILYPRNPELEVKVRSSQASYRPGEDAQVNLSVRAAEGGAAESVLGVVVLDRAVEERFRMDREFGHHSSGFNNIQLFLGAHEQLSGVSFRDLQRLDMSKPVSPELDLLADILLNYNRDYYPRFHGGDQYEHEQEELFGEAIKAQLKPLRDALASHYRRTAEYAKDEPDLRRLLLESRIDLDRVRDPWGMPFRPVFSVDKQNHVLSLVSAGADKRFDTKDDFGVGQQSWPYFRPVGEAIDKAGRRYHESTGGFIRDFATLRAELAKDGLALDQLKDRWGEPYQFDFGVEEVNYAIRIKSGGPDKHFSTYTHYLEDDFVIWRSLIDYFAKPRAQIDRALTQYLKSTMKFPNNDRDLREALPNFKELFETHRDPFNRPYYRVFKTRSTYTDAVRVESQAHLGASPVTKTTLVPVTRVIASVALRSAGPDGQEGTTDDFTVGNFSGVISEQERGKPEPKSSTSGVVISGNNGAIYGVVTDMNGAVIPNATITAKRSLDGQTYIDSTNDEGSTALSCRTDYMKSSLRQQDSS